MQTSDYGSGSSSNSPQSWSGLENWTTFQQMLKESEHSMSKLNRTSSVKDLASGTLDDVMREFHMNGSDSPYEPDHKVWCRRPDEQLVGMGPSSAYLRQKSWPAPESSPAPRLPAPRAPAPQPWQRPSLPDPRAPAATSTAQLRPQWPDQKLSANAAEYTPTRIQREEPIPDPMKQDTITQEHLKVLSSLPNPVLYSLLRTLEQAREDGFDRKVNLDKNKRLSWNESECRFCKNNGERGSWYRAHATRDAAGRVLCPVLRRYVCARCGASGDAAHTAKYCPLATTLERQTRAAMMRSVRMASGRRRLSPGTALPTTNNYQVYDPSTYLPSYNQQTYTNIPLDPVWAALEQKLEM